LPGDSAVPLPPVLELMWGRRERGRRGPRPELTVDAIVGAAMRIGDADGLEAVSMARVAQELGFTTMSLYRHVTGKDELLQLMWNGSARGAEALVLQGHNWREKLRMWAMVQRDQLDLHPWITQMPIAAPPLGPNSLRFVERGLEAMDGTGLPDADKLRVIGLLSSYTLSEARMAHDAIRAAAQVQAQVMSQREPASASQRQPAQQDPVPFPSFDTLLRELVDEQTYPRLHQLAWSAAAESRSERDEFLFGVDRILDGVQAFIAALKLDRNASPDSAAAQPLRGTDE
jgi:AcrR family transcriptional regulator